MRNNWPVKKLGEVATYFNDGNWIESNDQSYEGIRLIQTGNIGLGYFKDKDDKARFISEETFKRLRCSEIFQGDILISRLPDPVGRSCLIPRLGSRAITAVDCTIVRFPNEILAKYFQYFSASDYYFSGIKKYLTGSSRVRISRANLAKVNILLPPTSIQEKIVERLDAIRKAQEFCDQQIQKTEELFESILEKEISNLEKAENKKLNEICIKITDGAHKTPTYISTGIPFLSVRNMINGTIDFASCKFISESEHNELAKRCNTEFEDIVVAKSGTTGVATLVDTKEKFSLFVSVALLKLNKKVVDPRFVVFYLNSKLGKKQMLDRTKGGTIKNLHIEEIREITIPFPSLTEQKKIVEKLEAVQNYKKLLLKQKELLKELFDSVLDKSMKGELDS